MTLSNSITAMKEEFAAYRRELHQNPQTSYEEVYASDFVSKKLTEWGITHKRGLAVTGIVATIEGNKNDSGKVIGLRAELDALDMTEESGQPWTSKTPGKMHGCGHDGHTAMLLGAAKYLSENRNFNGKVHLIFQPAEEGGAGGIRMIEEGLFKEFPMDAIFAIHNWPLLPLGSAGVRTGAVWASSDTFQIVIKGHGGHAALPHLTTDPIVAGAQIVAALQSVISRQIDPIDQGVLSITNFNAGSGAHNVIPDSAKLIGTFRAFKTETRALIRKRLEEITKGIASSMGCTAEILINDGCDPTINTPAETEFCANVARAVLGDTNVDADVPPNMGAEDFGAMLMQVPGCYFFMGQGDPKSQNSPHNKFLHDTKFDFNDDLIPIGIEYWVKLTETAMPL